MSNSPAMPSAMPVPAPSSTDRFSSIWLAPHATGLLVSLCSLMLLDSVNGAMTATLRPYLMGTFSATPDQITWVAILYFTMKLYGLLLAARLQERFGQRRCLLGMSMALVLSTAGSMWVTNYPSLLVVQSLQGASGGFLLALGQGALLLAFGRKRQPLVQAILALTIVMFPTTITPALLGGYAYGSDWRWAYGWVVVSGTAGCAWLFWQRQSLTTSRIRWNVPVIRIALLITSLLCITYILEQGNRHAWLESPRIVWSALLAGACLAGLGFAETDGQPTYLRYCCFHYANFTFGICVSLLAGSTLTGSGFVIPGFMNGVLNYPVWQSGLAQFYAVGFATCSLLAVGLVLRFTKFPPLLFILAGVTLFATAMWHLGKVPSGTDFSGLLPWLMLRGLALGGMFLPLTLATLTCVPPSDGVAAAGLFNCGRQLGGLIGIAWLQTLQTHLTARNQTVFGENLSSLAQNFSSYAQMSQDALAAHGTLVLQAPATASALLLQEASRQMNSVAFNGCFESVAMLFAFALPLIVLARILTTRLLKPVYEPGQH